MSLNGFILWIEIKELAVADGPPESSRMTTSVDVVVNVVTGGVCFFCFVY